MAEDKHFLVIELVDHGRILIEIRRILSPLTTERMLRKFPMRSLGRYYAGSGRDYFTIQIDIKRELEKPTYGPFEIGEVVYEGNTDSLMVILKEGKTPVKVTKLGKLIKGIELFDKIERSCKTKLAFRKT